ncbi:transporter substrate-binding domain-containing protein [Chitinimonas sp. BJB300]|uniref:transporter substrate-binding domain-containing protein n=1 Tax=Chitinimonas sp. BJB300 TaxID=1559339 RepID=UPI000C0D3DED|nr:transporter substrate-binding domain-containing protein [Chitinimonas sp. BJB300]PHV12506.1 amino acid ABC transporter substrate-binding protein [Chitinimonas sp. BJB300]TSJ91144.1 transporter substrate-binding domain-containing protein [Chitinimonas sp. BJB300]
MKLKLLLSAVLGLVLLGSAFADDLDEIKKRGTLIVGVKDATPPFGMRNPKAKTISGYDVDFAIAIAKHLGVKVVVKEVESAQRIPRLQAKDVDLIIATMTKTAEREKQLDFSYGYFVTWQKFAAPKGKIKTVEDLANANIGTVTGSTSEKHLRQELPGANLVLFADYKQAFAALSNGELDAVSTEEPILAGRLGKMQNKDEFEIPDVSISVEVYGIGVRKGEKRLLKEVNTTIVGMEESGEAEKIFDRWFGPSSQMPLLRTFKIGAK